MNTHWIATELGTIEIHTQADAPLTDTEPVAANVLSESAANRAAAWIEGIVTLALTAGLGITVYVQTALFH